MSELDINAVVRRVFSIYVEEAQVLMPAAAVVFVLAGLLSAVLEASSSTFVPLAFFIKIISLTLFTGMVVKLVAEVQRGRRELSARRLLAGVAPVFWQLVAVALLAGVGVIVGLVLFVVPGLILITIWSVAAPVVVLEHPGAMAALRRSRELVRGNGWRVFGVILVVIAIYALGTALALGFAFTIIGIVIGVIVGVLTAPLSALASAVLYFDLRALQDGRGPNAEPSARDGG